MKINEQWEKLKEESHANIQSEKGILNRQIRSILYGQTHQESKGEIKPEMKGVAVQKNEKAR